MAREADAVLPAPHDGVTVLYFAGLRELVGQRQEQLALPEGSDLRVRDVVQLLQARHPVLRGRLDSVRVALNETFVAPDEPVQAGAVLALIPPVQGG